MTIVENEIKEKVIGFEALFKSMNKCKRNVMRKSSTQSYILNGLRETFKLNNELENGTYVPRKTNDVFITYPKPRHAVANAFRDRVYQRSLNDNALYPQISKQFIPDNMACQKGKGTDAARNRFKQMLHSEWCRNGYDIYILQCDVRHYYDSMQHSHTEKIFNNALDPWTAERVTEVLRKQYQGDLGYNPGSQMVQIAGITYLDEIDHYMKEIVHVKNYIRYMDDILVVHNNYDELLEIREMLANRLHSIGLELHPKKTHIERAIDGVIFLGFRFRLVENGKVVVTVDPAKVKANRIKLKRMVHRALRGEITRDDCDRGFECMVAHMSKGDSYNLIQKFSEYYENLWRENYDEQIRSERRKVDAVCDVIS